MYYMYPPLLGRSTTMKSMGSAVSMLVVIIMLVVVVLGAVSIALDDTMGDVRAAIGAHMAQDEVFHAHTQECALYGCEYTD
jgi:hypothetical protein